MSLVKLATNNYYIINTHTLPKEQPKTFGKNDAIALGAGTATGFTAGELADKFIGKQMLAHRLAGKLGQVAAGTIGTIGSYKLLHKLEKKRNNGSSPAINI